jgi:hypothetical protein
MSAHTPGPWVVKSCGKGHEHCLDVRSTTEDGYGGEKVLSILMPRDVQVANMHMASAAPEMFDLLVEFFERWSKAPSIAVIDRLDAHRITLLVHKARGNG